MFSLERCGRNFISFQLEASEGEEKETRTQRIVESINKIKRKKNNPMKSNEI